jgi:hypothetical protein
VQQERPPTLAEEVDQQRAAEAVGVSGWNNWIKTDRAAGFQGLHGENLAVVSERLELERVAAGIEQKHGGLFARFSLKADVRFDDMNLPRCVTLSRSESSSN